MAHYPAAFINAIAEEGTKEEAIEWLQKIWNELCDLRKEIHDQNSEKKGSKEES